MIEIVIIKHAVKLKALIGLRFRDLDPHINDTL